MTPTRDQEETIVEITRTMSRLGGFDGRACVTALRKGDVEMAAWHA